MAAVGQATLGALSQAAMELERSRLITLLHGVHVARQVDCRSEIDSQASCMWPAQYPSGCEVCRGRDAHWTALLRDGAMRRTNRHDRDTNTDSGCPTVPPASPRVRTRFGTSASRLGICWHRSESELAFADRGVKKSDPATEAKGPRPKRGLDPTGRVFQSAQPATAGVQKWSTQNGSPSATRQQASQHILPLSHPCHNHCPALFFCLNCCRAATYNPGSLRFISSAEAHQPWSKRNANSQCTLGNVV